MVEFSKIPHRRGTISLPLLEVDICTIERQPTMGKSHPEPVSPALVTAWLNRYRNLHSLIKAQPDGEWAWLWRLRCDILSYLLQRYGGEVTIRDIAEQPVPPKTSASPHPESTTSYERRTASHEVRHSSTHPPREPSDFRSRLQRLHKANDQVRKTHPDVSTRPQDIHPPRRTVSLSYPEEGFRLENERLNTQQRDIVEVELLEIRDLIANSRDAPGIGTQLSDDEILSILGTNLPRS